MAQLEIQNSIQDTSSQKPFSIESSVRSNPVYLRQTRHKSFQVSKQRIYHISGKLFTCSQSEKNSRSESFGTRISELEIHSSAKLPHLKSPAPSSQSTSPGVGIWAYASLQTYKQSCPVMPPLASTPIHRSQIHCAVQLGIHATFNLCTCQESTRNSCRDIGQSHLSWCQLQDFKLMLLTPPSWALRKHKLLCLAQ